MCLGLPGFSLLQSYCCLRGLCQVSKQPAITQRHLPEQAMSMQSTAYGSVSIMLNSTSNLLILKNLLDFQE